MINLVNHCFDIVLWTSSSLGEYFGLKSFDVLKTSEPWNFLFKLSTTACTYITPIISHPSCVSSWSKSCLWCIGYYVPSTSSYDPSLVWPTLDYFPMHLVWIKQTIKIEQDCAHVLLKSEYWEESSSTTVPICLSHFHKWGLTNQQITKLDKIISSSHHIISQLSCTHHHILLPQSIISNFKK